MKRNISKPDLEVGKENGVGELKILVIYEDHEDHNLESLMDLYFFNCMWLQRSWNILLPPLTGDIQIGMEDKKGQLEVEVIRARSLTQKPGSKSTPGKERCYCLDKRVLHGQKLKTFAAFEFHMLYFALSDWLTRQLFYVLWLWIKEKWITKVDLCFPCTIILSGSIRKSLVVLRQSLVMMAS